MAQYGRFMWYVPAASLAEAAPQMKVSMPLPHFLLCEYACVTFYAGREGKGEFSSHLPHTSRASGSAKESCCHGSSAAGILPSTEAFVKVRGQRLALMI